MTDRRKFLKTCGNIACLCGFGSILNLSSLEMKGAENDNATSEVLKNEAFALHWITELLDSLKDSDLTDTQKRYIIKKTSMAHHDLLNVPEMVKPYIGKPEEFIGFLQNA